METSTLPITRRYRLPRPLHFIQTPLIPQENFQILATGVGLAVLQNLEGVRIPNASKEVLMGRHRLDTIDDYALGFGEGLATVITDLIDLVKLSLWAATHLKEVQQMTSRVFDLMLGADPQTEALLLDIGNAIGQGMGDEIKRTLHDHQLLARTIGRISGEVTIAIILALLSGGVSVAAKSSKVGKLRWLAGVAEKFSQRLKVKIQTRQAGGVPDVKARNTDNPLGTTQESSAARGLESKSISPDQRATQPAVPLRSVARANVPENVPSKPKHKPTEQPAEILPGTEKHAAREVFLDAAQRELFIHFIRFANDVCIERAATKARSRMRFTRLDKKLKEIEAKLDKIRKDYPNEKKIPNEAVRKQVATLMREAGKIGRKRWDHMRGKVWNELYKDNDFLRLVQRTGVVLPTNFAKSQRAALIRVADPKTGKINLRPLNIDHKTPIALNPFRALDPKNHRIMTPTENSVFMEVLRKSRGPVSNDPLENWLVSYGLSPEERMALVAEDISK